MLAVISMYTEDCKEFVRQAIESVQENSAKMFIAYEKNKVKPSTIKLFEQYECVETVEKPDRHEPKVANAHNDALQAALDAGYKFFGRLDADNYYLPNVLPALVFILQEQGLHFTYGDHIKLQYKNGEWCVVGISDAPDFVTAGELIREYNKIPGNAILYDLKFAKKCGFWDTTMVGGWDVEMYIRGCCHGFQLRKVPYQNSIIVCERSRPDSLYSTSIPSRWQQWRDELFRRMYKYREIAIKEVFG